MHMVAINTQQSQLRNKPNSDQHEYSDILTM